MLVDKVYAITGWTVTQPTIGFTGSFGELVSTLVTWALILGALAALIFILLGGMQYITSGDDADKAEGARRSITNGVIGLIIIASAFLLWRLVVTLLGLDSVFGL